LKAEKRFEICRAAAALFFVFLVQAQITRKAARKCSPLQQIRISQHIHNFTITFSITSRTNVNVVGVSYSHSALNIQSHMNNRLSFAASGVSRVCLFIVKMREQ
jgi:DNA-binding IclR family transcriptional regulator